MDKQANDQTGDAHRLSKRNRRQQKRTQLVLSKTFTPFFWEDTDSRYSIIRTIRKRIERLMDEAGGRESYQKEILCQRAVFIAVLLETAETRAMEGAPFDIGSYTQMVNCLSGLLKSLGLEKRLKNVHDLRTYLAKQTNGER